MKISDPSADDPPVEETRLAEAFPATRWTLIEKVRHGGPEARLAREQLCSLYWYPIYAFLRRHGRSHEDAEDLTQGFFVKVLGDETFAAALREKGKLRTFLLQALKNHMADASRREGALKRGGGERALSFDAMSANERYANEPTDNRDPEVMFTRAWAGELVAGVRRRLRDEFQGSGRGDLFETLLPFLLWEEEPPSYAVVAKKLQASQTSVRLLVFRLRGRFREELRREISQTVDSAEEVESEIAWLRGVFAA